MAHKIYKRMLEGMKEKQGKGRRRKGEEWSVYILKCGDDSLYTGIAKDVDKRFAKHSCGKGARYTRTRLPLEIVYREACRSRTDALIRECAVKALPRPKKLELIEACREGRPLRAKKPARRGAKKRALALLALCAFQIGAVVRIEYPWQLRKDEEGIQVHVRKVPASDYLEFKARMVVDAGIDEVMALYEDVSRVKQWYYECIEAYEVKEAGPAETVDYFAIDMPWPVKDRDVAYKRIRREAENGALEYRLAAAPGYVGAKKGRVRITELDGFWKFTPLEGGKTEVYYQQHGEPGGAIPAFLVNRLAVDVPFKSFTAFRRLLHGVPVSGKGD